MNLASKKYGKATPKLYDGHFLKAMKDQFEKKFAGGVILGDCHYQAGKKLFKNVTFHVPYSKAGNEELDEDGKRISSLSKEKQSYNKQVRQARARVENTFGQIIIKFECLKKPWPESEEELDLVVDFAAGVFNALKAK